MSWMVRTTLSRRCSQVLTALVATAAAANILPSDPENRVAKFLCAVEHLADHFGDRDDDGRDRDRHRHDRP
jgi:hypothetical protein